MTHDDLIQRLRDGKRYSCIHNCAQCSAVASEAADTIEALQARLAAAEKVCEAARHLRHQVGDSPPMWASTLSNTLTLDLFDAVDALAEWEKGR